MRLGIGRGAERSQPDYRVRRTKEQFMLTMPPKTTPSDSSRQIGYGGQPTRKVSMDPCLVSILFAEYTPGEGRKSRLFCQSGTGFSRDSIWGKVVGDAQAAPYSSSISVPYLSS